MELSAADTEDAVQLPRAEIPLELQKNFTGLHNVPLFYAQYCRKLSHKHKVQNRVLIATLDHLYCCHPNGDILRCFPYHFVEKIFHDPERKQVGLVVPNEYDLLIALLDTFHFIHVVYTLRALHRAETPLSVELVKRSKQAAQKRGNGNVSHHVDPTNPDVSESAEPRNSSASTTNFGAPTQTFWGKFVTKVLRRPPPGVIIGWNDAFVAGVVDDDGSGESIAGSETEVCLGKGYYALRLAKPEGFQLSLHNVATEGGL